MRKRSKKKGGQREKERCHCKLLVNLDGNDGKRMRRCAPSICVLVFAAKVGGISPPRIAKKLRLDHNSPPPIRLPKEIQVQVP